MGGHCAGLMSCAAAWGHGLAWFIDHSRKAFTMNTLSSHVGAMSRPGRLGLAWALLSICATPSMAATSATTAEIQARYAQERARCLDGSSSQERPTCLKEAGAARDAALRGQLSDGDTSYQRNAKQRCDALTGDEARDCVARMQGQGSTSGSVEAGGIYRETVTRQVKPAEVPMPAPQPPSAPASTASAPR